jgi:hypothetical protein
MRYIGNQVENMMTDNHRSIITFQTHGKSDFLTKNIFFHFDFLRLFVYWCLIVVNSFTGDNYREFCLRRQRL